MKGYTRGAACSLFGNRDIGADFLDLGDQSTSLGPVLGPLQASPKILDFTLSPLLPSEIALGLSRHTPMCPPKVLERARRRAAHKAYRICA
jgi:hypothetical protein